MNGVEAHIRMRMQDLRTGDPPINQTQEPLPSQTATLAPPPKRALPTPDDLSTKAVETIHVPGHCVIVEVALHDRLQPPPGLRHRLMPAARSPSLSSWSLAESRFRIVSRRTINEPVFRVLPQM